MGFGYGKSTYSQIIADILDDFVEQPAVTKISKTLLKGWINRAIQEITENSDVFDEWPMRLIAEQTDYPIRDRPAITAATNATPIVVTALSHDLAEGDYINVRGVLGNLAANGSFRARSVSTDTFALRSYKSISDASNASPINIKCEGHGFSTGNTVYIVEVLGNTAANGTFTITVVDEDNFTLNGSAGNGAYTSGGVAEKAVAGTGAWTSGGKVWSQSEIPVQFKEFERIVRTYSAMKLVVDPRQLSSVHAMQEKHTRAGSAFDGLTAPQTLTPVVIGDVKYLRVYPAPTDTEEAILYGTVRYRARDLDSVDDEGNIPLTYDWEPIIRQFCRSKIWERLGDPTYPGRRRDSTSFAEKDMALFYQLLANHGRNMQDIKRIRATYK